MAFKVEKPHTIERPSRPATQPQGDETCLVIGLVNNMPDSALEATELQFSRLLAAASSGWDVRLRPSYLPGVPRGVAASEYLKKSYWSLDALQSDPPDALIVTGAEPLAPLLNDEPYWASFVSLLEWADTHTASSVWSCLAAHAAVQHLSGVMRQRLREKCSGLFEHAVAAEHPMGRGLAAPLHTPQSRWNELPVDALRDAGYSMVSHSNLTGANVFSLHRHSFMVFHQGHPEYDSDTLLREYRRDVTRFLSGTLANYPTIPKGYFSDSATQRLLAFKDEAIALRSPDLAASFPFEAEARELRHTWKSASTVLYENWLSYIAETRGLGQKSEPDV